MTLSTKTVFIAAAGLVMFVFGVFSDVKLTRWVFENDGRSAEPLLKRAALAWNLDASRYSYKGVQSTKGWVIVHRWERRTGEETEIVDVTSTDGLVCYSKRDRDLSQYQNIGCLRYPD
jgi:hypothetical protein